MRPARTGRPKVTRSSPSACLACCRKTALAERRTASRNDRAARRQLRRRSRHPLPGLAVLVVLREIGPEIACFLLVLDAGEDHLGAGNLGPGVLDVVEELFLAPGNAGILVGLG